MGDGEVHLAQEHRAGAHGQLPPSDLPVELELELGVGRRHAQRVEDQLLVNQRRLVVARQMYQAATSTVRYHENSINELRRTLVELEKS